MSSEQNENDKREIDAVIEMIRENPFPEDLEEAKVAIDEVLGTPIADDIDVEKIDVNGVACQMLRPEGADTERVLIYLHGGGYVLGSLTSHGGLASEIGRAANCSVLQVDYRLAPEHSFPAPIEDFCTVYRWLLDEDYEPGKISVAGDSAGGGLVMTGLIALNEADDPLPGAAICISPWLDLEFTGESIHSRQDLDPVITLETLTVMADLYMANQDMSIPTASPLNADLTGFPPLLIQVGESEILFSDTERLAAKAEAHNLQVTLEKWPEMIHVWHLFYPMLTEGRTAISRVGDFIRENTAN
jgi:acetyl esterase/lipase